MHSRPDDNNECSLARQCSLIFPPRVRARHLPSPSVTGHRCAHIGYAEFNPESWPSNCAPRWDDWMLYPGKEETDPICGTLATSSNYAEEFWNCSDITIESGTYVKFFMCFGRGAEGRLLAAARHSKPHPPLSVLLFAYQLASFPMLAGGLGLARIPLLRCPAVRVVIGVCLGGCCYFVNRLARIISGICGRSDACTCSICGSCVVFQEVGSTVNVPAAPVHCRQ